jgi:hypothetical protein
MNNIKCPNLVEWLDWVILMCKKGDRPYVPNSTELRSYCKNRSYNKCPHNTNLEQALSVKDFNRVVNNYGSSGLSG